jgi:hypothetical protein
MTRGGMRRSCASRWRRSSQRQRCRIRPTRSAPAAAPSTPWMRRVETARRNASRKPRSRIRCRKTTGRIAHCAKATRGTAVARALRRVELVITAGARGRRRDGFAPTAGVCTRSRRAGAATAPDAGTPIRRRCLDPSRASAATASDRRGASRWMATMATTCQWLRIRSCRRTYLTGGGRGERQGISGHRDTSPRWRRRHRDRSSAGPVALGVAGRPRAGAP